MYHYKQTEPQLWTVGTGEGKDFSPESDHDTQAKAAERVNWLNGGSDPINPELVAALHDCLGILLEGPVKYAAAAYGGDYTIERVRAALKKAGV